MLECGMFYLNRVMKDGGAHADWAKALVATGDSLRDFVKKHHTTGLAWGKKVHCNCLCFLFSFTLLAQHFGRFYVGVMFLTV